MTNLTPEEVEELKKGPYKSDIIADEVLSVIPQEELVKQFGPQTVGKIYDTDEKELSFVLATLETRGYTVTNLVFNPINYATIRLGHTIDTATRRDVLMSDLYGHFLTADVRVSNLVPKNVVFVTGIRVNPEKKTKGPITVPWGIFRESRSYPDETRQVAAICLPTFDPEEI